MKHWSKWFIEGSPEVGQYAQIEGYHKVTLEPHKKEGIIAENNEDGVRFLGSPKILSSITPYLIDRWRIQLPSDNVEAERKQEALL